MSLRLWRSFSKGHRYFYAFLLVLAIAALISGESNTGGIKAASTSIALSGEVTPLLAHSRVNGPANVQQRISLSIGLHPQNEASLNAYVQDIYRPGSLNYHRFLTPTQFQGIFSPSRASYNALRDFLQQAGFTITGVYRHRLLMTFSGTIGQAEQTFHVAINSYTASDGTTFYANTSEPVLPGWLAGQVESIHGLSNATRFQHASISSVRGHAQPHTSSCPTAGSGQMLPSQMAKAYNLNGLYTAGFHGEGQTVALFELAGYNNSDLVGYSTCLGNTKVPVKAIVVGSGPIAMDSGVLEVELDADVILSAAPQLGALDIYESSQNDYLAQWSQIVQDAVPVVSTSWGLCEQLAMASDVAQENTFFTTAAAQGQSIFVASGDSGSESCFASDSSLTNLNVDDPAGQPYVTAVGGTSLTLGSGSSYGSESVWNTPSNGASGGGISQYWQSPSWQSAPGVSNGYSSTVPCGSTSAICREVPDVSLQADPNNGYLVYCTWPDAACSATNPWTVVGGTSASAPMWAAWMALTNEMSLSQGGFNLGFANPLLYQVASTSSTYASGFHDITSGNNDFTSTNSGKYPATSVYDMATGLGSFNANGLAADVIALANSAGRLRTAPASTSWYFAEGSVGGGFQEYLTLLNPSTTQNATVNITYLFESSAPVTVSHTVNKGTRVSVSVNADLNIAVTDPQQAVATMVKVISSGPGIVAERPMYFNYKGIQSGTDVMGATSAANLYYFPLSDTRQSGRTYYTYITMLNPSTTQTATATITYYTGSCGSGSLPACPTQTVAVQPLHRGTATPLALGLMQLLSVKVQSDQPLVVERPMYMMDTIAQAGGATTGAASVVGARATATDWLFAEGYTGTNFQEYLVLANFSSTATPATITLKYDNGHTQALSVSVPPLGQYFFDVNQANAHPTGSCDVTPCQTTPATSAEIVASSAIVAERLMYFHYSSAHISGTTEVIGEQGPASHAVYSFAEGYTANMFSEYLTLQNPTGSNETVAVTLFADTYIFEQQVLVKAHSRYTLSINPLVTPIAQAYNNLGSDSYDVSLLVQALGSGSLIVAERPMYFIYHQSQGGTNVLGYTGG